MRQLAPLFGVSKSAVDRIIDHLGPMLALQPRKRFAKDAVLIVDGTLVPTRDHTIAAQSKNYRYSTNHQVVIDADTRLVVAVGPPLAGNRSDCKAWEESGAKAAVGRTMTITDGGYPGTGLVMPHRPAPPLQTTRRPLGTPDRTPRRLHLPRLQPYLLPTPLLHGGARHRSDQVEDLAGGVSLEASDDLTSGLALLGAAFVIRLGSWVVA